MLVFYEVPTETPLARYTIHLLPSCPPHIIDCCDKSVYHSDIIVMRLPATRVLAMIDGNDVPTVVQILQS